MCSSWCKFFVSSKQPDHVPKTTPSSISSPTSSSAISSSSSISLSETKDFKNRDFLFYASEIFFRLNEAKARKDNSNIVHLECEALLKKYPSNLHVLYESAIQLSILGKQSEAIKRYEIILRKFQELLNTSEQKLSEDALNELMHDSYRINTTVNLAILLKEAKRIDEAKKWCNHILMMPFDIKKVENVRIIFARAKIYYAMGSLAEAYDYANKIFKIDPHYQGLAQLFNDLEQKPSYLTSKRIA